MKTYPMPAQFDGAKFAVRYNLSAIDGDFWSDGTMLHVPDGLPDDPPIFEPPDPPVIKKTVEEEITDLKQRLDTLEKKGIKIP